MAGPHLRADLTVRFPPHIPRRPAPQDL